MASSPKTSNGGEQQDEVQRRAKTSSPDPREPGTGTDVETDEDERDPDDQGNAITDQRVNEHVAERAREQEEKKK